MHNNIKTILKITINIIIGVNYIVIVSCEYTTYESTSNDNATLPCPCQTRFSSLSKLNEKDIIWANGIVAKSKRHRFSFANNSIIIRNVSMSDSGVYVWVCDRDYVNTAVQLVVRNSPGYITLHPNNRTEKSIGGNLTITATSNSTASRSFIQCRFTKEEDCPANAKCDLLYDSRSSEETTVGHQDINIRSTKVHRIHVKKRSALDFDLTLVNLVEDDSGCYSCQESFEDDTSSFETSDGDKLNVFIIEKEKEAGTAVLKHADWIAVTAIVITTTLLTTLVIAGVFRLCRRCNGKGTNYQSVLFGNVIQPVYNNSISRQGSEQVGERSTMTMDEISQYEDIDRVVVRRDQGRSTNI